VLIITGRGLGSLDGVGRVRQAVQRRCTQLKRLNVVVEVREGLLVTHGRLDGVVVSTGDQVAPGEPVGTSAGSLYVGVRLHGRPVDPARCGLEPPSGRPRAVLVRR
jgi:hypothetical protein